MRHPVAISPAVDVTNYVMLELGHPMHAHDRSLITGGFDVRFARPGETVVTLDDIERKLDPGDVLIVDDVATAAIGGVMGAGTTEVRDTTTDVLLEAAVWDPAAVSRTQRRLHLASEAGRRYERSVDPAISVAALDRCAALLADIANGTIEPRLTDWRGDPPRDDWSLPPVTMAVDLPDRTAGVDYPAGTTERRLTQIGADVALDGERVTATPPSWRPDLLQPADLVEEVLRLEGLEIIPSVLPLAPPGRGLTPIRSAAGRSESRWRSTAMSRCCPPRSCPRACSTNGASGRRPAPVHHAGAQPAGVRPPALATTLLPGCWKPWGATCPAARSMSRCSRSPKSWSRPNNPCRRTHSGNRRPTDDEIATLDASLPRQPQHVGSCWPDCANRPAPGVPAVPCEATDAFEAVRVVARAAGVELTLRPRSTCPGIPVAAPRCSSATPGSWATPANCIPRLSSGPACRRAPVRSS